MTTKKTPDTPWQRGHKPRPEPIAPPSASRLISKIELLDRVPLSYPKIWELMRQGKFPRSRLIEDRVFWVSSEIDDYIAGLPTRRLKGDAAAEMVEA